MSDERTIQVALWAMLSNSSEVMMPRFTPPHWWECDLWCVSKTGYACEYEIKITRSDFKNDALKSHEITKRQEGKIVRGEDGFPVRIARRKHDLLAQGHEDGPSRFFYVCPMGLVRESELPAWAGLIEFNPKAALYSAANVARSAPRLHKIKASESVKVQAFKAAYYRFWRARENQILKIYAKE